MVMAANNSALLTAPTDISGLSEQFRDGQQLRQEYEARQQQRALNDLMKIGDFNERMAAAQQHKYAGALVPMLQQYEESRQKAALDNLSASADIQKTFAEAGKLGSEAGKIGAETRKIGTEIEGKQLDIAKGVSDYISAAALTQDPNAFGVKIGELYKRGILTQDQTQSLLNMVRKDPQTASALMQRMAMGNPEIAKAFMPSVHHTNLGDRVGVAQYNPLTGEYEGLGDYEIRQSPDNYADNLTSRQNNHETNQTNLQRSNISANASMYGADQRYKSSVYATDTASHDRRLKLTQDGQIEWFKAENKAETDAYNAETDRIKATTSGVNGRKPKPTAALKMENEYQEQIQSNAHTMKQIANWVNKINSGDFELGLASNALNSLANRTGIESLGNNPSEYAEFNSFIKDLANKALRLNKGVQTDSDYKRQLEGMISGDYIPRDKETALRLLNKIIMDFDTANRATYNNLRNVKAEYGEYLPEYGTGARGNTTSTKKSKGTILGDSIFK